MRYPAITAGRIGHTGLSGIKYIVILPGSARFPKTKRRWIWLFRITRILNGIAEVVIPCLFYLRWSDVSIGAGCLVLPQVLLVILDFGCIDFESGRTIEIQTLQILFLISSAEEVLRCWCCIQWSFSRVILGRFRRKLPILVFSFQRFWIIEESACCLIKRLSFISIGRKWCVSFQMTRKLNRAKHLISRSI